MLVVIEILAIHSGCGTINSGLVVIGGEKSHPPMQPDPVLF
ncbi:hypothetical protein [Stenotrophomonas ginsengisoli]|nr:hypothetical protein [Stenotrophomonas ginsengisoli]